MKEQINKINLTLKSLLQDRGMFMLYLTTVVIAIIGIVYVLVNVKPSELQLVSHYTAFGTTHLYRSYWFNQFGFVAMIAAAAFLHILVAQMMFEKVSRPIAQIVSWTGIAIILFVLINASLIINVWSPL
jgi:hypothetical protein